MNEEHVDITDPTHVAKLVFSAEDGVVQDDLTWQSYVDVSDDGSITVDVYPDHVIMGEADVPGLRYRIEYLGPAPDPSGP